MNPKKRGKGAFGDVYEDGNMAIKKLKKPEFLVQELIAMKYLRESKYVVSCRGYDLTKLELRMDLYDMSLKDMMDKYDLTNEQKRLIFSDILCGVSSIHSLSLIHCDLKHSNILVTQVPLKAVICDLGISSVNKYARFFQTPKGYRRPDQLLGPHLGESHDLYSLSVLGIEMFGNIRLETQMYPERLMEVAQETVNDPDIRSILVEFSKTESDLYPSARSALNKVFNTDYVLAPPVINLSPMRITTDDNKYIHDTVKTLTSRMNINKGRKGYYIMTERLNNPSYPVVDRNQYTLYISSIFLLLSAMFNNSEFNYNSIIDINGGMWKALDIDRVLTDIINKDELMNILMIPN